jgi:hypothetical protein
MKKLGKALGAVAIAGAIAAGGSAFTASNSVPGPTTIGYGTQTITGVTATSITYNLNATKDKIESVDLVLTGDTTLKAISLAWGTGLPALCDGTADFSSGTDTTYTCSADGLGGSRDVDDPDSNALHVIAED